MKYWKASLYTLLLLCSYACSTQDPSFDKDEEVVPPEEEQKEYEDLFTDSKYLRGFKVGSTDESNGQAQGYLNYNEVATGTPVWLIAQWNCINNDILRSTYTGSGSTHEYKTEGGNRINVNTQTGVIILDLNTVSEYGKNGIASNPRKANEPWPTMLLEYGLTEQEILKVSDKQEIRMAVDFNVLKAEDKMPTGSADPGLHTAQFQWFITVQNRNLSSPDFGRYIWFGLNLYDKRFDFAPLYAAEDGGKEQNTGAFIYMPDMRDIMGQQGKTEIGKTMRVDYDVLPVIKKAFALAQQRKYLIHTSWEELYIGASNIGWEVPGTYNTAVQINSFNVKYR